MKIAVISDIHEDVAGLQRAMKKIEMVKCDQIVCLGDISGFSMPHYHHNNTRNAHECLQIIKKNCSIVIPGNHDLNACKRNPEISPEFSFPENWFELDYFQKKDISKGKIWLYEENELIPYYTKHDLEYIRSLPQFEILGINGSKILFCHYAYPNISGSCCDFYHAAEEFNGHFKFMQENSCDIGFIGHAHPDKRTTITTSNINQFGLKKMKLHNQSYIFITPAIVGNKRSSGFCIFNTDERSVETIRI